VINFDAPGDRDAYVHRIGRTARAGRDGAGISFVLPDQAGEMRQIATSLGLGREFDHGRPTHVNGSRETNRSRETAARNGHRSAPPRQGNRSRRRNGRDRPRGR